MGAWGRSTNRRAAKPTVKGVRVKVPRGSRRVASAGIKDKELKIRDKGKATQDRTGHKCKEAPGK
jgi:hypothetical protein